MALEAGTGTDLDTPAAERPGHRLDHVLVAAVEDGRQGLEHRDRGAEVAQEGGEFTADGPPADDRHRTGEFGEGEDLVRGHHQRAVDVEPGDGPGHRTRRQHHIGTGDLHGVAFVAGDTDPVVGEQRATPAVHGDPAALHQARQALEQLVDHLLLAGLADREVHAGWVTPGAGPDAEPGRSGYRPVDGGRLQKLLGRDTAPVEAGSAHLVHLDHGHRQTGRRSVEGGGVTPRTSTDDHHVVRRSVRSRRSVPPGCRCCAVHLGCRGNHLRCVLARA